MEDFSFDEETCPEKNGRFGCLRKRDLLLLLLILLWLGLKELCKWSYASVGRLFQSLESKHHRGLGLGREMITCPKCCTMTGFYTGMYIDNYIAHRTAAECQCANCGLIFAIPVDRPLGRVLQEHSGQGLDFFDGWSPHSSRSPSSSKPIHISIGSPKLDNRKRVTARLSDLGEKKISITEIRGMVIEETNLELKKETDNESV